MSFCKIVWSLFYQTKDCPHQLKWNEEKERGSGWKKKKTKLEWLMLDPVPTGWCQLIIFKTEKKVQSLDFRDHQWALGDSDPVYLLVLGFTWRRGCQEKKAKALIHLTEERGNRRNLKTKKKCFFFSKNENKGMVGTGLNDTLFSKLQTDCIFQKRKFISQSF